MAVNLGVPVVALIGAVVGVASYLVTHGPENARDTLRQ